MAALDDRTVNHVSNLRCQTPTSRKDANTDRTGTQSLAGAAPGTRRFIRINRKSSRRAAVTVGKDRAGPRRLANRGAGGPFGEHSDFGRWSAASSSTVGCNGEGGSNSSVETGNPSAALDILDDIASANDAALTRFYLENNALITNLFHPVWLDGTSEAGRVAGGCLPKLRRPARNGTSPDAGRRSF